MSAGRGRRARGGAVVGEDERGNSAGPVVSGVWAELCLPLTVCLCVFREARAESVGIGEGFVSDSRSPTPSLNQTPREGFVRGADEESGAWVPVDPGVSGESECVFSVQEVFVLQRGLLCLQCWRGGLWTKVERGWRDGTRCFGES